jgi:hypothetical protein
MTDQFPDATQMVLSPAAQAIVNAAVEAGGKYGRATPVLHARIVAALRAAADQVVPDESHPEESQFWDDEAEQEWQNNRHVRLQFLAIAAELEGQ